VAGRTSSVKMGSYGGGVLLVQMGWCPLGLSVPLPPLSSPAPQNPEISMMARINIDGYYPVSAPTCLRKQHVGKPSRNAAKPHAKAEGCVHDDLRADKLRKGGSFRVGTWNIDSLTGKAGELVQALAEKRMDVACVKETQWRGSRCRFFGAIGKRYKLLWMGSKAKTDVVGIFVAEI